MSGTIPRAVDKRKPENPAAHGTGVKASANPAKAEDKASQPFEKQFLGVPVQTTPKNSCCGPNYYNSGKFMGEI